jgi:hypothetical protein
MAEHYWRPVFARAWSKTRHFVGWSKEQVVSGVALFIGTVIFGGMTAGFDLVGSSISVSVGLVVVAVMVFVWSVFQTQKEMYRELDAKHLEKIGTLQAVVVAAVSPRPPAPDYDKWRHRPSMNLRTAAQLWSGERPSNKLVGDAKETYEMLYGAVQAGELALDLDPSVPSALQSTDLRMRQERASADTVVTRASLKTFAKRHNYDPIFLRD